MNVSVLLSTLGIQATKVGRKWKARCPSPEHNDADPSWSIIDNPGDRKNGSHYCFACGFRGGPWELAAAVWRVSVKEAGQRLKGTNKVGPVKVPKVEIRNLAPAMAFKLPIGSVIPEPGGEWFEPALSYLTSRGVTREQIDRWGLGYAIKGKLRNRVIVPVWTEGALRTFTARAIAPGMNPRYEQGRAHRGAQPRRALWGEPGFDDAHGVVTVAEGVFSAMALERCGALNPAAILGSEITPERARILSRFPRILIATDPDKAGDKVAKQLQILARRATVARLRFSKSPDDEEPDKLSDAIREGMRIVFG